MYVAKRIRQKAPRRRLNRSREMISILLIMAGLAVGFFLVFGDSGYLELRKKEREIRQMELNVLSKVERNKALEKENEQLRNDPGKIEELARKDLKLTREGEIVVHLKSDSPPSSKKKSR